MEPLKSDNVSQEAKFEVDELFFSITDKTSAILSGNEVFYRISGYTKDELIGHYHNIIRHGDMPKIVFKTLWDYIQSDRPIIAYVKNKAKDGSFYWVIAAVFALEDRYVSIRFKPSSKIFELIRPLYLRLLIEESKGGVEASGVLLAQQLEQLGYSSYDHFMSDAFLLELQHQKELSKKVSFFETHVGHENPFFTNLKSMHDHTAGLIYEFDQWFDKVEMFLRIKNSFEEKGLMLRKMARDVVFLSLNASVSSYKVEHGGETFGVLASDIRVNAKENDLIINAIDAVVQDLSTTLHKVIFTVCCMHLQIEMIDFFLEESGKNTQNLDADSMIKNSEDLMRLVIKDSQRLEDSQQKLASEIGQCLQYLERLEKQMLYLGYIQIYGIIEAAANAQEAAAFGVIFAQLKELTQQTSHEVEEMQKMARDFNAQNSSLIQNFSYSNGLIHSFHGDIVALKDKGD